MEHAGEGVDSGTNPLETNMRIVHATDLLDDGGIAFEHAVALAHAAGAELTTLHANPSRGQTHRALPAARDLLKRWHRGAPHIEHHRLTPDVCDDPVDTLLDAFNAIDPDLLVVGAHRRTGLRAMFKESVATAIARNVTVPILLLPIGEHGFVDSELGQVALDTVVIPVGDEEAATRALSTLASLLDSFGVENVDVHLLSVDGAMTLDGLELPATNRMTVTLTERAGPLEAAINHYADEVSAALIVMATRQQDSVLDFFMGTHTERVVQHAGCPVLCVPLTGGNTQV
ncbi:MAG: nucleotide-binding universal stress UspA family protein [Myxococcota bacterium]|jgi:nucleotide-binding universal stress UspA family protein